MMMRALRTLSVALALAASAVTLAAQPTASTRDEVIYQIFVRSFRDSNGDGHGDLKGIEQQLGYLQQLGVTTLLLTPIGPSPFYHNYFLDDFAGVDPVFGGPKALRDLTSAVHRRGMRIVLDMELQYVSGNHPWFTDSFKRPASKYTPYLLYQDAGNTTYQTGYWDKQEVPIYNGKSVRIATVNLLNPDVQREQTAIFTAFLRPTAPGRADGVDGFRLDHMQDTLDGKPALSGLFTRFWTPLFRELRQVKPNVRLIAEQADWGYGDAWLQRGDADMVFAFPLRGAILSFDKAQLHKAITETARRTPAGKQQIVFIENHDVQRFASAVNGDARKAKVGAALNVLLQGVPLIYYGQELGMTGTHINDQSSDGGDIPLREAFPWTAREQPGMAVWYRNSGPWWDQSPLARGGGVSLEAQRGVAGSLFETYRALLALRKSHVAFRTGDQMLLDTDHPRVFAFRRSAGADQMLVVVNLGDTPAPVQLEGVSGAALQDAMGTERLAVTAGHVSLSLPPFAVRVFAIASR
jgi:glycosidase